MGIYPLPDELSEFDTNDDTVLLIDVGGGKGHVAEQIRTLTKDIKGRVILPDLPKVIEDISEPLPRVERMKYDFFTAQPVQGKIINSNTWRMALISWYYADIKTGALIYYIRHCLYD